MKPSPHHRPRGHFMDAPKVTVDVQPSDDPELLGRFDRWLQRVLLTSQGTPDKRRRR